MRKVLLSVALFLLADLIYSRYQLNLMNIERERIRTALQENRSYENVRVSKIAGLTHLVITGTVASDADVTRLKSLLARENLRYATWSLEVGSK